MTNAASSPLSQFLAIALLTGSAALASAADSPAHVAVTVHPTQPLIEVGKGRQQLLNLDFRIDNATPDQIVLSSIEVNVLGKDDTLIAQYRVGSNGNSVQVIPNRAIAPGKSEYVFNPLVSFPDGMDLSRLRVEMAFDVGDATRYRVDTLVRPARFTPKASLSLPLDGPVLVHDGHDLYGHHRRLPLLDPMAQALQWKRNFMRYSYDFVLTDAKGKMYKGDGARNEDWYGWGAPVSAPAAGKVLRVVGNLPDNAKGKRPPFSREQFIADPSLMWGNHVEIEHGNGEVSMLAHLKSGSVKVAAGERVRQGQQVGEVGFSGDAFVVHLHYDLKSGPGFDADGLPSPFADVERFQGSGWLREPSGHVDSGDIVRRAARPAAN